MDHAHLPEPPAAPRRGLSCDILRHGRHQPSPMRRISSVADGVVLTDPRGLHPDPDAHFGVTEPQDDPAASGFAPELQLRRRCGRLVACPPDAGETGSPYAASGTFLWTCDSRFPAPHPIPVHDYDIRLERR